MFHVLCIYDVVITFFSKVYEIMIVIFNVFTFFYDTTLYVNDTSNFLIFINATIPFLVSTFSSFNPLDLAAVKSDLVYFTCNLYF